MIRLESVYKSFDKTRVLSDISAVFEAGKTNLIIGQSGSGKQCCSSVLLGFTAFQMGRFIIMNGRFQLWAKRTKKVSGRRWEWFFRVEPCSIP